MIRLCDALAFRLDHPQIVDPDGRTVYSKDDYDLCDRENENLRAHLAWAANQLPLAARRELRARIDALIDSGGVAEDLAEETREVVLRALLTLKRLVDHMAKAIGS